MMASRRITRCSRDVEEVSLDLFRILLEGDHALDGRHLAEGIGALVEAVTTAHDLGISDGRAFRAMHAHIGGRLGQDADEQVDAEDLKGYRVHGAIVP